MAITEKQRELRRKFIGSSDCAAILGLSPFGSPAQVWLEKTGKLDDHEDTDAMTAGNLLEPVLLDWLDKQLGITTERNIMLTKGVMCANLDGASRAAKIIAEGKHTGRHEDWGDAETSDVPAAVCAQAMHQAEVAGTDFETVYVPVAMIQWRSLIFKKYIVPVDRAACQAIGETMTNFWEKYIRTDTRPDDFRPSLATLERVKRTPKKIVPIDPDVVEGWRVHRDIRLAAEKEEKKAYAEVLAALSDAEGGQLPDGRVVTYLEYEQNRKAQDAKVVKFRSLKLKGS